MTINQSPPTVDPAELDRIDELVRYLAEHDGRMPTDDLPLSWWLVDALDQEKDSLVRQALADIPVRQLGRDLTSKKAHAWATWLQRYDQLIWIGRRGQGLDEALPKDKTLRDWYNDKLSRHHVGSLGALEAMLLEQNPLWDPSRLPDTKSSKGQMAFKIGISAVRDFYLEHKHTDIPEGFEVAGLDIHQWWQVQRSRYAGDGGMKEHLRQQFVRLGNLGVDLRTDKERAKTDIVFRFRDRLTELAEYIDRNGMSALPERGEKFVNTARSWIAQYHNGKLEPELREALEAIDGWSWEGSPDLELVREYMLAHGHVDLPRSFVAADGRPIGAELYRVQKERWVVLNPSGAVKRRNGHLNELARQGWDRGTRELRNWRRSHDGMPDPACVTSEDFRLGEFVEYTTRMADQALLPWLWLKDLSRATDDTRWLENDPAAYADAMAALTRFAKVHRHCLPAWGRMWEGPKQEHDLARFMLRIRADRDADDLAPTDVLRLEALPGWSWSQRELIQARMKAKGEKAAIREPVRSVRTDVADPDTKLNRAGLRQFLPAD